MTYCLPLNSLSRNGLKLALKNVNTFNELKLKKVNKASYITDDDIQLNVFKRITTRRNNLS